MAGTTRSSLGDSPVPKSRLQGGTTGGKNVPTKTSKSNGGFGSAPPKLPQSKRKGVTPKARGGSGTGARKGNSLPR